MGLSKGFVSRSSQIKEETKTWSHVIINGVRCNRITSGSLRDAFVHSSHFKLIKSIFGGTAELIIYRRHVLSSLRHRNNSKFSPISVSDSSFRHQIFLVQVSDRDCS